MRKQGVKNDKEMLASVHAGYDANPKAPPPSLLFSSPLWLAYHAGKAVSSMTRPVKASMSRGYSVRLEMGSGAEAIVRFTGKALDKVSVERL